MLKIIFSVIVSVINYFILVRWPLFLSYFETLEKELKIWGDPIVLAYLISFLIFLILEYILYKNVKFKQSIIITIFKFTTLLLCFVGEMGYQYLISNSNDPTAGQGYGWLLILTIVPGIINFVLMLISSVIGIIKAEKREKFLKQNNF